jgi:hypothetical protein
VNKYTQLGLFESARAFGFLLGGFLVPGVPSHSEQQKDDQQRCSLHGLSLNEIPRTARKYFG